MGNTQYRPKKPADQGRMLIVCGAGEDEANGVYVETTISERYNDGRSVFIFAGRSRSNAPITIEYTKHGGQWSIRKEARTLGSTSKLWYIANAGTGADTTSALPPATGWAVSSKANDRAFGEAAFSIEPAPTIRVLEPGEAIPSDVLQAMFLAGVKYAADGE
jgi:hypothetical protein